MNYLEQLKDIVNKIDGLQAEVARLQFNASRIVAHEIPRDIVIARHNASYDKELAQNIVKNYYSDKRWMIPVNKLDMGYVSAMMEGSTISDVYQKDGTTEECVIIAMYNCEYLLYNNVQGRLYWTDESNIPTYDIISFILESA